MLFYAHSALDRRLWKRWIFERFPAISITLTNLLTERGQFVPSKHHLPVLEAHMMTKDGNPVLTSFRVTEDRSLDVVVEHRVIIGKTTLFLVEARESERKVLHTNESNGVYVFAVVDAKVYLLMFFQFSILDAIYTPSGFETFQTVEAV